MARIAIITDSTCNMPDELVKQCDIYVAPQHLIWGTEDLRDVVDITPQQFYERLVVDPVHPKTSQPPASEFTELIDDAVKVGAQEVFIVTISSQLSGTYASAVQASEVASVPVRVVDSFAAGMGLGWQVLAAAHAREQGADLDKMVDVTRTVRKQSAVMLTVDTLEFLHRGGRIGGAAKLVGTALNIKPQLVLNMETGAIEPGANTRTRGKAIAATYDAFFAKLDTSKPLHVALHHAAAEAECQALADRVRADFPRAEVMMNELTPVIGTHTGPGTLGLCGYYEA